MQFRMYFVCACATLSVVQALAHGPQIQIAVDTNNGNKITTHKLMFDEPYSSAQGLTAATSIYVMPVLATSSLNPAQIVGRVKPSTSNAGSWIHLRVRPNDRLDAVLRRQPQSSIGRVAGVERKCVCADRRRATWRAREFVVECECRYVHDDPSGR